LAVAGRAADLIGVQPLTDGIVMLQFSEGHVDYHQRGQPRSADTVQIDPLDVAAASAPASYRIESPDDLNYRVAAAPLEVGRKSKGVEFAWYFDEWVDGHAVNHRPDHVKGHWLYLKLPYPMRSGKTYLINTDSLARNGKTWALLFDEGKTRSEAVHVNIIGYVPTAPAKFGYLYHWMGDKGSLDLKAREGSPFFLADASTGRRVFAGRIAFRMPRTQVETSRPADTPHQNFLGADVWECDFSGFTEPGSYVLVVPGIGSSWPFRIASDVYREPFYHVARSLYHNRSGIELREPFTEFTRPAPHNPGVTPGFARRLFYTTTRFTEWGSEGGVRELLDAGRKGNLEATWGWYQDAGDWDGYISHLRVAQELLFAYEMTPGHFRDGELNIPESGNGVPDIVDEAAWLPRYCQRLHAELMAKGWGTGGIGLRVAGDAYGDDEKVLPGGKKVGQGSWEDVNRDWMVSGEDPWSTFGYAGAAAHLAYALRLAGVPDPKGVDWKREAIEAFAWALKNTRAGDENVSEVSLRDKRLYAAAALFRLTGEARYEKQFMADAAGIKADSVLDGEGRYGPWLYALGGGPVRSDPATLARIRSAVLHTADVVTLDSSEKRALRWGGPFGFPMLVGQQTTPAVFEGAVAYTLVKKTDPAKARRYLSALYTTCDYFLGTNSMNMTWITGVGPRSPSTLFHMDAWYNGKNRYPPGYMPYGPWLKDTAGTNPTDQGWAHHTVYPDIDEWPGNERYFPNRCSPMLSEFTIHQQSAPAAALFGFLTADTDPAQKPETPRP
jgi:hypothetical protein